MSTTIEILSLSKHYKGFGGGVTRAVDGISLSIRAGELFFLLGPSGCGKTTLLRMIAGFIEPTGGSILFNGREVANTPPSKRNTGMVFQSYALWPHMTVAQNVAYGLKVRRLPREQREKRVAEALRTVRMESYADRKPNQLSGGQQQRVALARALVVRPDVLLLDEPLSNLDAKLRLEMRAEIRRICNETGITTVYVTHDQKEALSMADGIAVLDMGVVAQTGKPRDLYLRPASRFVADFLGETNFISAEIVGRENGTLRLRTPAGALDSAAWSHAATPEKGNVTCSVRPEAWRILGGRAETDEALRRDFGIRGTVVESVYLGEMAQHVVDLATGGAAVRVKVFELHPTDESMSRKEVILGVDPRDVVIVND